jgi:aminoglycoside 6'-N-acetyltransferase
MSDMHLRRATLADQALLEYWDTKPHVLSASGDDDWFDWASELTLNEPSQEILIAEAHGRPIGVLQIIDPAQEKTHYWGEVAANLRAIDIWIGEESDLGRGYGTEMMRLALERCFAAPEVEAVLIDPLQSNTRALRFYERLGFRRIEAQRFISDDCYVYRLDRKDWPATL